MSEKKQDTQTKEGETATPPPSDPAFSAFLQFISESIANDVIVVKEGCNDGNKKQ